MSMPAPQRPSGQAAQVSGTREALSEAVARAARERSEQERESQPWTARRYSLLALAHGRDRL